MSRAAVEQLLDELGWAAWDRALSLLLDAAVVAEEERGAR
jgi:hypothetical protein